jgi:regulator of replication initiation timing
VSGSLQNVVQSTDEITGVAEAFDDLGEELVNNRIENSDLKNRLGEQIARPLHQIAQQRMPQLAAQLKLVEEHIEDPAVTAPELKKSIALADQLLIEMRRVLDRMLELETYNEVVTLLRDIISDQDQINKRTKEQQKDRLRSLFQD